MDQALGSTRMQNATPAGSLEFAQGSTGWLLEGLLAVLLALVALVVMRARS
jgi:Ca-activated chloride channel family protein